MNSINKQDNISYVLKFNALKGLTNDNSISSTKQAIANFSTWCYEHYGIKRICDVYDVNKLLNEYVEHLKEEGYSVATIHTYLAHVCKGFGIEMGEICKPKRTSDTIVRGRTESSIARTLIEEKRKKNIRLAEFAKRVGIRRDEYAHLKKNDFVKDESGYWCVRVRCGKGGKSQLQRILPEYLELVSSYFDGTDKLLFSQYEMHNKINLHSYRSKLAKQAYFYYKDLCNNPEEREKLKDEICLRWKKYNRNSFINSSEKEKAENSSTAFRKSMDKCNGEFILRGHNRKRAEQIDMPRVYDRVALMAVSVFHLSHWRLDVTVTNYITA